MAKALADTRKRDVQTDSPWGERLPKVQLEKNVERWLRPVSLWTIRGRHWLKVINRDGETKTYPYWCRGIDETTEKPGNPEDTGCIWDYELVLSALSVLASCWVLDMIALNNNGVLRDKDGNPVLKDNKPIEDPILKILEITEPTLAQIQALVSKKADPTDPTNAFVYGDPADLQNGFWLGVTKQAIASKKREQITYKVRGSVKPSLITQEYLAKLGGLRDLDKLLKIPSLQDQVRVLQTLADPMLKEAITAKAAKWIAPYLGNQAAVAQQSVQQPGLSPMGPVMPVTAPAMPMGVPVAGAPAMPGMPQTANNNQSEIERLEAELNMPHSAPAIPTAQAAAPQAGPVGPQVPAAPVISDAPGQNPFAAPILPTPKINDVPF